MDFHEETLTKHELLLQHIEGLKIGSKISVRKLAKEMQVSEGTAYRAVKEAENIGYVLTKDRIGTIRVDKASRRHLSEHLTFEEVVKIVGGHVLGGSKGLVKPLHKYVIGAMELEDMLGYIDAGSLLIVGNRQSAHRLALQQGAGVLITGGFEASREVKLIADALDLPIISCKHDTFTVASLINRAIYDRLIKKKIMLIEDIVELGKKVNALKSHSTIRDFQELRERTGQSRFPVVDEWNHVIGMITYKDISVLEPDHVIDKHYTRNPITVTMSTSLATAAHMMAWEGIEVLPIVDRNRKLLSTATRKQVLQAMRDSQKLPQLGETFDDLIWSHFEEERDEQNKLYFRGQVTPQMSSHLGSLSKGVFTTIVTQAVYRFIRDERNIDHVVENMTFYFLRPVQIEKEMTVRVEMIEASRRFCKVDVVVTCDDQIVCKSMITAQAFGEA
ncbi:DRTGG domain-containing protein [Paenibacillus guangzhouensis]|uniref:DRTGG domain-containing protein n=1 Tax=Paenibacillus guangzhouensis TaxID=1473112 RepID=UPI0012673A8F|nr:DRTGG domain-containing protein [Paenibacillus guangzhouensis]